MKQIFLLSLSFFCFYHPIFTQNAEFAPIGAYWKSGWSESNGSGYTELLTTVVGDTVVNRQLFKKLKIDGYTEQISPPAQPFRGTRIDFLSVRNDSVFLSLDQTQFLYCFSAKIGDTIKFNPNVSLNNLRSFALADSIGRIDLGGVNRRVVYFSKYCKNRNGVFERQPKRSLLVENFGLLGEFFTWELPDCGVFDLTQYYFRCYQFGSFTYPVNRVCSPTVATNEPSYNQISIFPNPVNNELLINYRSELQLNSVELMNYLGQKISVNKLGNNQKINVSNVPNGVYFLRLLFDNQSITKKILIQH